MARFRLRYQSTNFDMPRGDFSIGRSSECNLALADALVSRTHAILHVDETAVVVEDLKSRNGVSVNGVRIEAPQQLQHMDRVYIGSQELVLIDLDQLQQGSHDEQGYVICSGCGAINGSARRRCGECGATLPGQAARTLSGGQPASREMPEDVTRKAKALDVIGGIASKAIAMGRYEEAERMLQPHLANMLARARERSAGVDRADDDDGAGESLARIATRYAVQLCQGMNKTEWLDWVFDLHIASGQLMEAETVDTLHRVVRQVHYTGVSRLREYLANLRTSGADFSPSDRFVLRRLEGLEQVIAAN